MIAPEPFFGLRGTPFSIYHRLRALSRLGHEVDLATYHLGEDVSFPGLAIRRIPPVPLIRRVPIGPSCRKLPLDALLFAQAARMFLAGRHDCLHTHEEAAVLGALLHRAFGTPHVYDMHSSLPEQLSNYDFMRLLRGPAAAAARLVEAFVLRNSTAVIAICPHLKTVAEANGARGTVATIENPPVMAADAALAPGEAEEVRRALGAGGRIVALYTGTFEHNQGIGEIIRAAAIAVRERPDLLFVLVGGEPEQVEAARALAAALGVEGSVRLPGRRPLERMPAYMAACDMLLSYRQAGTNTPLKLYSYLWSGRPTVATDRLVHTQVLTPEVAILTEPTPEAFARGVAALAADTGLRRRLGRNARRLAEREYTDERYLRRVKELYDHVERTRRR